MVVVFDLVDRFDWVDRIDRRDVLLRRESRVELADRLSSWASRSECRVRDVLERLDRDLTDSDSRCPELTRRNVAYSLPYSSM
jgi:hypothetical protein